MNLDWGFRYVCPHANGDEEHDVYRKGRYVGRMVTRLREHDCVLIPTASLGGRVRISQGIDLFYGLDEWWKRVQHG